MTAPPTIALRPLDVLTLGYFALVSTLITVLHSRVPGWYAYPLAFTAGTVAILALLHAHARRPDVRTITLLRYTYPLFASPVVYGAIGGYVLVLRGHFLDAGMNTVETRLYGVHPTEVLARFVSAPLTELLYACYFGFYLFFLVPPLLLFLRRRDADLERYVLTLAAALYVCYLGFLVVPLRGPIDSLAGSLHPATLTGYVVVPVQKFLMAKGDPAGACFPSAHVAGAWAGLAAIRSLWGRRAYLAALAPTIGLTVAVVYTRYHYLTDAFGGLAVAGVCVALVGRAYQRAAARENGLAGARPVWQAAVSRFLTRG
jgi:hypothetical protein